MSQLPGAVTAPEDSLDSGVPWHFGDPFAEQRAAARSAAVVDRSHRPVLIVSGEDRLTWLHSLTSQHFTDLRDGQGTESLVLTALGRVEHHFAVAELDGRVYLDTEAATAAALLDYLTKMIFWSKVELVDASADLGLLSVLGPSSARVLADAGLPVPEVGQVIATEDGFVRGRSWPGTDAVDLLLPRDTLVDRWRRLCASGAVPAGSLAWEALRVESLTARLGADTDERTIPHEVNWIPRAVHLTKGCYRGQETVARVHNLGRPPRRMVLLHLDGGGELPPVGADVRSGDRTVGRVGTVVRHHELGDVALALIKRSVPVEAELTVGELAAAIDPDSVPAEDAPKTGRDAVARLRGRV